MTDENAFWTLIEGARRHSPVGCLRADWLAGRLARRPVEEIVAFQLRLDELRVPAGGPGLLAAARVIQGGRCSDDGFWYFQAWLVGLGRDAFRRAVTDPDSLADVPEVRRLAGRHPDTWTNDEWPEWEVLDYAAAEAYERATGEEGLEDAVAALDDDSPLWPEPEEEPAAAGPAALPRLTALFPPRGPA
ncbi:DUF4240 domain-containing protein [Kitasatospora sp. NPDC088346]|uniref:DUF4240 domain-containing protein n=1 Tax=Kitasatospora sp. NPDC088346 TaxID=3364073 RepID=UPI00382517E5